MKMATLVLLLLLPLVSATGRKVFLFPEESDSAYVRITPKKPLNLQAFTLCMRIATELKGRREIILFAYRTQDHDELNVWREEDGRLSLYLRSSSDAVMFDLLPLYEFPTHLCVTWQSITGATSFWVNGHRSMVKIYRRGHRVDPNGAVILGQDPDSFLDSFDKGQSFKGEISDVHMWDSVLSASQIWELYENPCGAQGGNVIDWNSDQYQTFNNVVVLTNIDG
ncbi:pentraxin fusion protein-like [Silurus meridionalis]|uniref:pentraxin fusion protein-like n=1 Tax=Silurus meridionalis TaxID=175797 RepID=UPI001EEBB005|nr:pentraxin fusion protein-like [Silurus meridionalis]XP_046704273.1 pentraxin fusion protein-like [Silurus meridionalis]